MNISKNGIALIQSFEGLRLQIYNDTAGLETIGIGHLLTQADKDNGTYDNGISVDDALSLLRSDLSHVENYLNGLSISFTQNEYDACCSLAFNIGTANFDSSSVKRCMLAGDIQGAGDAFLLWDKDHVNGQLVVVQGLLNRRIKEQQLFLS